MHAAAEEQFEIGGEAFERHLSLGTPEKLRAAPSGDAAAAAGRNSLGLGLDQDSLYAGKFLAAAACSKGLTSLHIHKSCFQKGGPKLSHSCGSVCCRAVRNWLSAWQPWRILLLCPVSAQRVLSALAAGPVHPGSSITPAACSPLQAVVVGM